MAAAFERQRLGFRSHTRDAAPLRDARAPQRTEAARARRVAPGQIAGERWIAFPPASGRARLPRGFLVAGLGRTRRASVGGRGPSEGRLDYIFASARVGSPRDVHFDALCPGQRKRARSSAVGKRHVARCPNHEYRCFATTS
jgi:hypothetical protein